MFLLSAPAFQGSLVLYKEESIVFMKGRDYRKEGRKPKERRQRIEDDSMEKVTGGGVSENVTDDAKYCTSYGRNRIAKITLLDGSNRSAIYNGNTHEWEKDDKRIPEVIKHAVESYYA